MISENGLCGRHPLWLVYWEVLFLGKETSLGDYGRKQRSKWLRKKSRIVGGCWSQTNKESFKKKETNKRVKKSDKEHSDLATKQLGKKPDYRASRKWKLGVLHIFFLGDREKGRNIRNKIKAKKKWGQKSICFLNQWLMNIWKSRWHVRNESKNKIKP